MAQKKKPKTSKAREATIAYAGTMVDASDIGLGNVLGALAGGAASVRSAMIANMTITMKNCFAAATSISLLFFSLSFSLCEIW